MIKVQIYFAIRMFNDSRLITNAIFQSVIMLLVGLIPSLLDREDSDEYLFLLFYGNGLSYLNSNYEFGQQFLIFFYYKRFTMLEMYKEIGLRETGDELKATKFPRHTLCNRQLVPEPDSEHDQLLNGYVKIK
jgi:hypothetical protein